MCSLPTKVLVIEDDAQILEFITSLVEKAVPTALIYQAENYSKAQEVIHEEDKLSLIIADKVLPDGDGIKILDEVRESGNLETRMIVVSGYPKPDDSPYHHMPKPLHVKEFAAEVKNRVANWRAYQSIEESIKLLDQTVINIRNMGAGRGNI